MDSRNFLYLSVQSRDLCMGAKKVVSYFEIIRKGTKTKFCLWVDWGKCFKIPSNEMKVITLRLGNEKLAFVFFHGHINSREFLLLYLKSV